MTFWRLFLAEGIKLKRSALLRMLWLLPLIYLALMFLTFHRPLLSVKALPPGFLTNYTAIPLKLGGALWGGFFHPLILAVIPALLFWSEHKGKLWRHLHAQPISRRHFFLVKLAMGLVLCAFMLSLVWIGSRVEFFFMGWLNPALSVPFRSVDLAKLLAWLWLGSLPLLALYVWVSDRVTGLSVPVVFGLVGLMLTVGLSGQEVVPSWRRDLIPWVLPYFCAQQSLAEKETRQEGHLAGDPYRIKPNLLRLPSGKIIKTWQNVPDEVIFPPPPPTPKKILASFSVGLFLFLTALGLWDAGRQRV